MNNLQTANGPPPEILGPFPPSGLLETITCKDRRNGSILKMNVRDFGGKLFPKKYFEELTVGEKDEIELAITTPAADPVRHSLFSAEELATMPVSDLKKLPEYKQLADSVRKKLRTKQQYVDAFIQVRQDVPVTPNLRATF